MQVLQVPALFAYAEGTPAQMVVTLDPPQADCDRLVYLLKSNTGSLPQVDLTAPSR